MNKINHNCNGLAGLQNCMDIQKSEHRSSIGICHMSSDGGNQFVGIKVVGITDIKMEDDPWPATSTRIATEPAVSCMSVCLKVYAHWTDNIQTVCRI